jgi:hypothetical protein
LSASPKRNRFAAALVRGRILFGTALGALLLAGLRNCCGSAEAPLLVALASLLLNGAALGFVWYAAARRLRTQSITSPVWNPLLATTCVALVGYAAFWLYLAGPAVGRFASSAMIILAIADLFRESPGDGIGVDAAAALRVAAAVGVLYIALLYLFPTSLDFYALANGRWRTMYHDNSLPHAVAIELYAGRGLHWPAQGWQASDRPPLQSGWMLLTWVFGPLLGIDDKVLGGTSALWLQLTWVFALYGLLGSLGMARGRACAWICVLGLCGFFIFNSVFTWPKLAAGAFGCGVFGLWAMPAARDIKAPAILAGAVMAAVALLCHSGVAFSLVVLAPFAVLRTPCLWKAWICAFLLFLVPMLPWTAFQNFYAPPGNRLLKMHLAGQIEVDPRGTVQTIRDSYAKMTWGQVLAVREANFSLQLPRDWAWVGDFSAAGAPGRRGMEFFLLPRSLTWWIFGLAAFPVTFVRWRSVTDWGLHLRVIGWILGTVAVWCLVLFFPTMAILHQGSYCVPIALFAVLSVWFEKASPLCLCAIAVLQTATFLTTWTATGDQVAAAPLPAAVAIATLAAAALAWLAFLKNRRTRLAA